MLDFEWVAIGLGDFTWIAVAFVLGFLARGLGLPPLLGFLAAGFLLSAFGYPQTEFLQKLADMGITLLLFTVGLKLNLRTLARPQVWGVSAIHMTLMVGVLGVLVYGLALAGVAVFADLDAGTAFLLAFALSFSSTVFVVKVLEEKGEMAALHGRIAVGILIMQDIAAVLFMAVSSGKVPSMWATLLLLLIPLRPLLHHVLNRVGHGELQVLYGFMLALGGAEVFELVELKGDLGALVLGVLIASHPKAEEMAKDMLAFKDLFLLGFFLSVGAAGQLSVANVLTGALLVPLVLLKSMAFFALLNAFRLRARTSLLATLSLSNYSEFGLIVAAVGVSTGWLSGQWLIVLSVALALSFVAAAGLNRLGHEILSRYHLQLERWQRAERLPDDRILDIGGAKVAVIGMGGIGTGAYDLMRKSYGERVVGIDIDPVTVRNHQAEGRQVLLGDPSDVDFWDRVQEAHTLQLVLLALPRVGTNLEILKFLRHAGFAGRIAVTAKFADEEAALLEAGASTVFNIYSQAGAGFAEHVNDR
jgi:predicted Kef-type K+ transport protein